MNFTGHQAADHHAPAWLYVVGSAIIALWSFGRMAQAIAASRRALRNAHNVYLWSLAFCEAHRPQWLVEYYADKQRGEEEERRVREAERLRSATRTETVELKVTHHF